MEFQDQQQVQLLIIMRLRSLHQEGFERVTYDDLERVFFGYIWKKGVPPYISQIADVILNISADKIIRYLSVDSTVSANRNSLSDMLKGELYDS